MTETILACPLFGRRIEFGRLTRLRFGEPQKARVVSCRPRPKTPFEDPEVSERSLVLLIPCTTYIDGTDVAQNLLTQLNGQWNIVNERYSCWQRDLRRQGI